MRYTTNTPVYEIDLDLDEIDRWTDVMAVERAATRRLARVARRDIEPYRTYVDWLGPAFEAAYKLMGGRYAAEIQALSEAMRLTSAEGFILNCQYELTHAADWAGTRLPWPFGCTAGIRHVPGLGMVHARSMDWQLPEIGNATRIVWFRRGRRRFVSVHILGFVGVLSGMVPKSYSASLNWLPPQGRPTFNFGPAFLLREVLEECDTFNDAVRTLRDTVVSTAVSFTVCGARRGEACVIEHTGSDASVRKIKDVPLVQGNQFNSRRFQGCNDGILESHEDDVLSMFEDSSQRQDAMTKRLSALPDIASLQDVGKCLLKSPVRNDRSYQQMVFCPKKSALRVWRKIK